MKFSTIRTLALGTLKVLLGHLNMTVRIRIGSQRLRVPLIGGLGLDNLKQNDPWMIALLQMLITRAADQGAFVDIGANVGQTLPSVPTSLRHRRYERLLSRAVEN